MTLTKEQRVQQYRSRTNYLFGGAVGIFLYSIHPLLGIIFLCILLVLWMWTLWNLDI